MEKNIVMVLGGLLRYAAIAGIATSAILGFVLTHLMIHGFTKDDRPRKTS